MSRWRAALVPLAVVLALAFAGSRVVDDVSEAASSADQVQAGVQQAVRPVANDCSGGSVVFTFDDGPRQHTGELLDRLRDLRIRAVFFWSGHNLEGRGDVVRRAAADGHVLGNHTQSHANLTSGVLPSGATVAPWGAEQIRAELQGASDLLERHGAPAPQYYRPPYGAVNRQVDDVALSLGMRLVMSYGHEASDGLVDSHDTEGISAGEVSANVIGQLRDGVIITMHDGLGQATLNSIEALQPIVDEMNQRRLCATTEVRPDASGRVLQFGE
ncbi:polysaccharide deacetylase family protein [Blastococcus sp. TML/M2B]|uniref:polysaccharide deacetylase family protein n=1 Tax=unclassified Blastococcus TaxID=2619396 RepID=UPI00190E35D6|nr:MULTISPECIES: polysaccharide deacetylase family protein [unclassified Blastococcus]MBN1091241.1 polysaccharide deacetylase family protein [Blastococcus sp. TML/M2B]MBN1095203.1 polysaccharide deacetylase family protein [Blastococcus sp. TML/C7B]